MIFVAEKCEDDEENPSSIYIYSDGSGIYIQVKKKIEKCIFYNCLRKHFPCKLFRG